MSDILMSVFYYLVFPGFIFSAVAGLLSCWFERKVTARLQWRVGPPWYQPFADILKLLGKELIVPANVSISGFLMPPLFGLAAVTLVSTILMIANIYNRSFMGDLIVVIYLLTIPSLAIILGGSASRNPFGEIGSSREIKMLLSYELPFLIAVFTVIAKTGSVVFGRIIEFQTLHGQLAGNISCTVAFLVMLMCVQAKLSFVPFDIAEAEQEIMGGPLIEYSGPALAVFKLTKAMMLFVMPVLLITLFFGGVRLGTLNSTGMFALKYALIILGLTVIKNVNPRLKIDQAMKFFWGHMSVVALLGLAFAMIGM